MPKSETDAMQIAFDAIRGQTPDVENRLMNWLIHRLREDRHSREVAAYAGPDPIVWQATGPDYEPATYDTRAKLLSDICPEYWDITEIAGLAAVRQEFIVAVPVGDENGVDYRYESFPARENAEAYVTRMKAALDETF